ncbi:MAG TPA: 16S rRNA (uracil(1498)-N(3))-methyltransferase [Candidatus Baltobacteraceae bacterium]|nr:16S rRNA (uracil(1498)-N(3))-methyltransferase [Candidatus Baltobacteraceae bacterium]
MGARRFFVADAHEIGDGLVIDGGDAHKIVNVLRLHDGDEIEIADSAARIFRASIQLDERSVRATLRELVTKQPIAPSITIDVAQGIPKGAKMDFIVEKLSELGVASIVPLESERTIVRDLGGNKLERWRRLAKTAAAQSGRADVATIAEPVRLETLFARFATYDAVLFPWELAQAPPLREALPPLIADARRILVIVGPEGGFSHAEAEMAMQAGAHVVSLGSQILRTETAALVLLSVLRYLMQ